MAPFKKESCWSYLSGDFVMRMKWEEGAVVAVAGFALWTKVTPHSNLKVVLGVVE